MKLCRALKETLNAGDKVNLDCESVLVVACVLKDFLRNIPGSVFTSDLYAKWVSITDGENEEEKIAATQRLLDELPRANAELLRYLFGVLHNIQQHSSVNQMTAYNLATCIAPSILCLPNACSAELESDITRKISLVQFLIENCLQIFGEDIASLLGESSMHCDGSEKAADPSTDFGEDIASLLGESSMHCDGSEKAADPSTDFGEKTLLPSWGRAPCIVMAARRLQILRLTSEKTLLPSWGRAPCIVMAARRLQILRLTSEKTLLPSWGRAPCIVMAARRLQILRLTSEKTLLPSWGRAPCIVMAARRLQILRLTSEKTLLPSWGRAPCIVMAARRLQLLRLTSECQPSNLLNPSQ
nr:T-cell activation Rho GTPase-activating protein-like isoform X3 [Equus asinus]